MSEINKSRADIKDNQDYRWHHSISCCTIDCLFIITGFIVAYERGGVLANNHPSSNPDEGGAILQYLDIIL